MVVSQKMRSKEVRKKRIRKGVYFLDKCSKSLKEDLIFFVLLFLIIIQSLFFWDNDGLPSVGKYMALQWSH